LEITQKGLQSVVVKLVQQIVAFISDQEVEQVAQVDVAVSVEVRTNVKPA
jgi:hypothetical protein